MRQQIVIIACLCSVLAFAIPVPDNNQQALELVQIPLNEGKELDILSLGSNDGTLSERNKRTIGILRDLFPELTKQVEDKVNMLVAQVIRAVGPTLLRTAVQGNAARSQSTFDADFDDDDDDDDDDKKDSSSGSTSVNTSSGARVRIELPTFAPDTDDDDDDDVAPSGSSTTTASSVIGSNVQESNSDNQLYSLSLRTDIGANEDDHITTDTDTDNLSSGFYPTGDFTATTRKPCSCHKTSTEANDFNLMNGGNSIDVSALSEQLEETIRVARQAAAAENLGENNINNLNIDQLSAESKSPAIDELTLDTEEADGDDRNKRFLSFGFGGSGGGSGGAGGLLGGSGGGSGNFLFDVIRRTADRAARAAGTVYRVVAGTESLDLNNESSSITSKKIKPTTKTQQQQQQHQELQSQNIHQQISGLQINNDRTARTINNGLFSGSVSNQQTDANANAPDGSSEDTANRGGDGYTEGIPGPVTRLFVLANRGLSNLIQDLILRIAQTSERVVNFKARLITSLI